MKAEMQSFKAPGESYEIEHPHAKVTERDVHAASLDSGVCVGWPHLFGINLTPIGSARRQYSAAGDC